MHSFGPLLHIAAIVFDVVAAVGGVVDAVWAFLADS